MRCAICGKGKVVGRNVSHSGVHTRRVFLPNLHWKKIVLDGKKVQIKICTKCLKRMKKNAGSKQTPQVPVTA
ncbi:50S ribosomal protein L28 [Candidatus Microgenomates bacterium]|nr:50S ribosomal protein L28 [Candidatus Microgenomates bacterium]